MGEYDKGLEYHKKALEIILAVYGTETADVRIGFSYSNLGRVYYRMGEYSKALKYHTESLKMMLAVYGAEATHADIATTYNNIGSTYDKMCNYNKALEYHTKSSDMLLAVYGAEAAHRDIATSYNNIGLAYYAKYFLSLESASTASVNPLVHGVKFMRSGQPTLQKSRAAYSQHSANPGCRK
ncbi:hypothetical protein EB796_003203 [Bugula neritina]|uniref:TTC28 n=1 Tax=Bugula neritina TaxID=10212 RepID=A0A7J7KJR8_BUGNE|nr:hypothetical protein EB796_003203 [Bugula neritina]